MTSNIFVIGIGSQRAFKSASELRYLGIEWNDSEKDVFRIASDEWDTMRKEFEGITTSNLMRAASVIDVRIQELY